MAREGVRLASLDLLFVHHLQVCQANCPSAPHVPSRSSASSLTLSLSFYLSLPLPSSSGSMSDSAPWRSVELGFGLSSNRHTQFVTLSQDSAKNLVIPSADLQQLLTYTRLRECFGGKDILRDVETKQGGKLAALMDNGTQLRIVLVSAVVDVFTMRLWKSEVTGKEPHFKTLRLLSWLVTECAQRRLTGDNLDFGLCTTEA